MVARPRSSTASARPEDFLNLAGTTMQCIQGALHPEAQRVLKSGENAETVRRWLAYRLCTLGFQPHQAHVEFALVDYTQKGLGLQTVEIICRDKKTRETRLLPYEYGQPELFVVARNLVRERCLEQIGLIIRRGRAHLVRNIGHTPVGFRRVDHRTRNRLLGTDDSMKPGDTCIAFGSEVSTKLTVQGSYPHGETAATEFHEGLFLTQFADEARLRAFGCR